MVRQDDGLRVVFPGIHDQDIAFMQLFSWLLFHPPKSGKAKSVLQRKGTSPQKRLAFHAGLDGSIPCGGRSNNRPAGPGPAACRGLTLYGRFWTQSALSFVAIFPFGQRFNVVPVRGL